MDISDVRPTEITLHPVHNETYLIPTISISTLLAWIKKIVRRRTSGLMVHGRPRKGKTRAIKYCTKIIPEEFKNVPAKIYTTPKKVTVSEDAFFSGLLRAMGHASTSGTVTVKRDRLINFMYEKAMKNTSKVFLLFVDEAQKCRDEHFEWLRDIYDELELLDVRLIVVLVGQVDMLSVKSQFIETRKSSIVSRFMIMEYEYLGLCSQVEMADCLSCYDTAIFPDDSDWTYTRFFFPLAYKNGFRLGDCADKFWRQFEFHHKECGLTCELDVPMRYFTKAVEILLTEHYEKDSPSFILTEELIREVILESWFLITQEDLRDMDVLE